MKKTLIAVAAAAALTATSAFAEITFGAWLRVLASPVASTGEDIIAGVQNSWGWGARTARININGTSEDGKAGFVMGVYNDFESGLMVEADPMDGLHAFAVIPMSASYKSAEEVYRNIQVGFGYAIEGVGKLKAQFIGDYSYTQKGEKTVYNVKSDIENIDDIKSVFESKKVATGKKDKDKTTGQIGVAFDLTAVENLYVTVGARFGIADKDYKKDYLKMAFTAGASYQVSETMKFSVDGGYKQYQDKVLAGNDDSLFSVGAGVDFTVMDGLAAVADVRYISNNYGKKHDDGAISFLIGVNKSVSSNGSIGIGFQGATNNCGLVTNDGSGIVGGKSYTAGEAGNSDNDNFVWAIPVSVSVWF